MDEEDIASELLRKELGDNHIANFEDNEFTIGPRERTHNWVAVLI